MFLSSGHPNSSKNANTTPFDQPKPVCIAIQPVRLMWNTKMVEMSFIYFLSEVNQITNP